MGVSVAKEEPESPTSVSKFRDNSARKRSHSPRKATEHMISTQEELNSVATREAIYASHGISSGCNSARDSPFKNSALNQLGSVPIQPYIKPRVRRLSQHVSPRTTKLSPRTQQQRPMSPPSGPSETAKGMKACVVVKRIVKKTTKETPLILSKSFCLIRVQRGK